MFAGRLLVALCGYVLWCVQESYWLLCVNTFCGVCRKAVDCFVYVRYVVRTKRVAGRFVCIHSLLSAGRLLVALCGYVMWYVHEGSWLPVWMCSVMCRGG